MPRLHEAIAESGELMHTIKMLVACVVMVASGALTGVLLWKAAHPAHELTYEERRNIAIDFMQSGTWRYVLCNAPMDKINHEEGETGK